MSNHTVPAAAEGVPDFITMEVNAAGLQGMSMEQLIALHRDINTLREIVEGMLCRPCYSNEHVFTPAGDHLDVIECLLLQCLSAIDETARLHVAIDEEDASARAEVILSHEIYCFNGTQEIAELAKDLDQDVRSFKLKAKVDGTRTASRPAIDAVDWETAYVNLSVVVGLAFHLQMDAIRWNYETGVCTMDKKAAQTLSAVLQMARDDSERTIAGGDPVGDLEEGAATGSTAAHPAPSSAEGIR